MRSYGIGFNWAPDSQMIAYTTGKEDGGPAGQLFIVSKDGSEEPLDLTSAYGGVSDDSDNGWGYFESGQGRMGGTLWERRSSYIENSPLFYFDRVSTPLLLVCGTGDKGATAQTKEAFSALRRLGQRVELRLYHGEDHWPGVWSDNNKKDLCHRVIDRFETYLKA